MIKKPDSEKFCVLEPDFPNKGYVAVLVVNNSETDELRLFFPLPMLYKNLEDIPFSIQATIEKIEEENFVELNEVTILDTVIIFPVTLQTRYPLKYEFWQTPSRHYDTNERVHLFYQVMQNPKTHMLLVTPFSFDEDDKRWLFLATLPLSITYEDKDLEYFMQSSDCPVEVKAKYAAIYSFDAPIRFNWKTGEIEEVEKVRIQNLIIN